MSIQAANHPHSVANSHNFTDSRPITILTVPKSGTRLTGRLLEEMNSGVKEIKKFGSPHLNSFFNRWKQDKTPIKQLFNDQYKFIVVYRDPRDALVSMLNYIKLDPYHESKAKQADPSYTQKSITKLLNRYIKPLKSEGNFIDVKVSEVFNCARFVKAMKTKQLNNVLYIQFEDIVGPECGGSDSQKQIQTVIKLAQFCNKSLSIEQAASVIERSLYNSANYNPNVKKKVGQWKEHANEKHQEIFKNHWGSLIEGLGYTV